MAGLHKIVKIICCYKVQWSLMFIIYSAAVTAVFKMEDGSCKRFTRAVEGTSSGYRINHEVSVLTKFESLNILL